MKMTYKEFSRSAYEAAFAKEAEACTGLLYRVSYTLLHNDADCQDAVQEALLKA